MAQPPFRPERRSIITIIIIITIMPEEQLSCRMVIGDRAQLQHNFQTSTRRSSNFGGALATLLGRQIKSCAVYLNNHNLPHHPDPGPLLTRSCPVGAIY